ncbi:MAG: hypothetical protein JSU82_03330 [Rhodospirillales bacterium]|nr:MAG: hypothetical protein JSU82_03330 [Rhodospirillales bacterium]
MYMGRASEGREEIGISNPSAESVRSELALVLGSELFSTSPRMQQFLSYIVEETLAGRGARVKGKTIAADVYGRDLDMGVGGQNLVRVEARRLRRLLDEYYAGPGRADPLHIHVDPGGYTPRFTRAAQAEAPPSLPSPPARVPATTIVAVAIGAAALVVGMLLLWPRVTPVAEGDSSDGAVRQALRAQSVPTLQAADLAQETRGLLFPLFDTRRQKLALEMFRHSIQLAPTLADGYAGAAQVLAVLAIFSFDADEAAKLSAEAGAMADKALALAPSNAWAHGAKALHLAVLGDDDAAIEKAQLAISLEPDNGYVLDLVGITAILAEAPDLAADVSRPDRERSGAGRFGARNIWGVSQLMLGRDRAVIATFKGAPAAGAPISAPSLIFEAVAHDRLGEYTEARSLIDELGATWPNFPARFLVGRIFREGTPIARDILQTLDRYGYAGPKAN